MDETTTAQVEAQDQTQQTQDTGQPTEQGGDVRADAVSGTQKRIDELTARFYRAQEEAAKKDEYIQQLVQQVADMANRPAPQMQNQPDPYEAPADLDPSAARYMQQMMRQFENKLNQAVSQLGATVHRNEAAQAASRFSEKLGLKDNGWVAERAASLAAGWKQAGLPFRPEDAARFAMGEFVERQAANPTRDDLGRFMPRAAPQAGQPAPAATTAPARPSRPANFDRLSPEQQLLILEREGVGNLPL